MNEVVFGSFKTSVVGINTFLKHHPSLGREETIIVKTNLPPTKKGEQKPFLTSLHLCY